MAFFLIALVLAVGGPIYLVMWINKKIRRNFTELAKDLGLEANTTIKFGFWAHPKASGVFRGRPLTVVSTVRPGSAARAVTLMLVERGRADGFEFKMVDRWRGTGAAVETGDAVFDKKYWISSNQPDRARRAFDDKMRAKLLSLSGLKLMTDGIVFFDRTVQFDIDLLIDKPAKLELAREMAAVLNDLIERVDAVA